MKYLVLFILFACSSQERKDAENINDMSDYYGCYHNEALGYYPEFYRNKPCDTYEKEKREIVVDENPILSKESEYAKFETVPIGETVESYETELVPYEDPENKTTRESEVEVIESVGETTEFVDGEVVKKVKYQKFIPDATIEEVQDDSEIKFENSNEALEEAFEEVVPEDY